MNIKMAQQENSLYSNYWEVLGPGIIFPNASENERKVIGEAKQTFTKYLAMFRKHFESEERRKYAVEKLVKALKNKTFEAGPTNYADAARTAQDGFYEVMESVKNQVKSELEFGSGEDALDISINEGGTPWTVSDWGNTLGMMKLRAAYQYGEIKARETKTKQDERVKKLEMRNKARYFGMVKALLNRLDKIVNGYNPENKKLAPNNIVPNSWLSGARSGGAGIPGSRRRGRGRARYPGARYPGAGTGMERTNISPLREQIETLYEMYKEVEPYGETSPQTGENIERTDVDQWQEKLNEEGFLDRINNYLDKRGFEELNNGWLKKENGRNKLFVEKKTGNVYLAQYLAQGKGWKQKGWKQVGNIVSRILNESAIERTDVDQWQEKLNEEGFLDRINNYLNKKGFEELNNGWLKKENGRNKLFVEKKTGNVYLAQGKGWKQVGNIVSRILN